MIAAILALPACGRGRHRVLEVAYVSAPQAALRDQVAAIFNRVGNVKNGERVEVLEREKRFARIRTSSGLEGWIEQRMLWGVYPGEAVTTTVWEKGKEGDAKVLGFETANPEGTVVLANGEAVVA